MPEVDIPKDTSKEINPIKVSIFWNNWNNTRTTKDTAIFFWNKLGTLFQKIWNAKGKSQYGHSMGSISREKLKGSCR
ncbi:hypothetical protein KTT66_08690 [Lacticaseibacillus casei]|uniref:hypothetical protein n=1 Tax=Lacticaseibacillus casei TaxID=1582 RepID=UPI001C38CA7E|nr:hypothetical protein [Lacticaseibacillus casei]QXG58276.1 hypothetical protein KTT66_08690 [Lacticaseibacillus casei]